MRFLPTLSKILKEILPMKNKSIKGDEMPITYPISNFEDEIYQKLVEAQTEARSDPSQLSHEEVFDPLRKKIAIYVESSENQG